MGAEIDGWDWDYLWHYLGGLAINGILCVLPLQLFGGEWAAWLWWLPFVLVVLITIGGVIREQSQHKWKLPWELTAHQWLEGVLWGVGALTAALVGLIFLL